MAEKVRQCWFEDVSIISEGEILIPTSGLCIYCQKDFDDLHNHVKIFHPYTYASVTIDRQESNGSDNNSQSRR